MTSLRIICMSCVMCVLPNVGYCDLPPTRSFLPKPPVAAPVTIVEGKPDDRNPNAVAKIIIPKSLLSELEDPPGFSSVTKGNVAGGTIVAGLAMTAAAISLMFVLRNSPRRKAGLICLIGCVVLAGVVSVWILFGPASNPASSSANQSKPPSLILIEVQDQGHEVILMLPKSN